MVVVPDGLCSASTRPPVRGLLIVARDQPDLYDCLRHAYGDRETLTVLLDRRQGQRRQSVVPIVGERRRDRRRPPTITEDLRFQQYVLVRPHYRRPQE